MASVIQSFFRTLAILLAAIALLLNGEKKPHRFQAKDFASAILVQNKEVFERLSEM